MPQTAGLEKPENIHYTNIVRALACMTIVWTHIYPNIPITLGGKNLSFLFHPNSSTMVFIFYFLSAYGIGSGFGSKKYIFTKRSLITYLLNRIFRIVPLYFFCLSVLSIILYFYYPISMGAFIQLITFNAADSSNIPPLLSGWFMISTLMQFYLVAPALYKGVEIISRKINFYTFVFLIILFGIFIRQFLFLQVKDDPVIYTRLVFTTVLGNIDIFLLGILFSTKTISLSLSSLKRRMIKYIFIITGISWYMWSSFIQHSIGTDNWVVPWEEAMMYILPASTSLLIGVFLLFIKSRHTHTTKRLSVIGKSKIRISIASLLSTLGSISFGIYLWHFPLASYIFLLLDIPRNAIETLIRMAVIFTISALLSTVTHLLVEKPALRIKKHILRKYT